MLRSTEVTCLSELIGYIVYLQKELKTILWFRGQRDAEWDVQAGVYRDEHREHERNYMHRFRSRAGTRYANLPRQEELSLWLGLMQHYGLPTRLLDWSRSPLVATYFALETYLYEHHDGGSDAAIWVLEPHKLNFIECGADVTPTLDANMCEALVKPAFFHRWPETNRVLAVMASEHDLRMFVQQGCFTIHSDPTPLNLRPNCDNYLSRFVVPENAVRRLAHEIEVCGFRKGDIYPDLGNLASELRVQKGA
jgi:hypothetical protein